MERTNRTERSAKATLVNFVVAAALVAVLAAPGLAALPAPAWMPNSPILAGAQVIVLWLPVPGAVKYNIYLNGQKIGESAGVQHIIAAPEVAGEHKLVIAAVDAAGAEGAKSPPGVVRIIMIEPPKSLVAREAQGKVAVRWDKATGAVIYNVYRSETKDGDYALLASVQSESHTDGTASTGKTYWYAVSAKDLGGKESKRSEPFMVSLVREAVAAEVVKATFKALPTEETGRVGFIDGKRIAGLTDLKFERSSGNLWVIIEKKIFRMSRAGEVAGQIGPIEGTERFIKMDFGTDGNLYVSDLKGRLYALDRSGAVRWTAQAPKPPLDAEEIWKGMPPQIKANYESTPGDVLCLDKEIWVTDQMFALIYVYDYSGKFQRYIYKYTDDKGKEQRFSAIGEIERLKDGRLVLVFPLAHYAVIVDKDLKEVFSIGKVGSGFVGRFIGIAGATEMPDGSLLLTDPAVNSIQAFDGKTGRYLYHIGGDVAKEDQEQPGRAYLDFGAVAYAWYLDAQNLVLFTGSEKSILFLKLKKG